ncbi:MAG: hypothetical protein UT33_C0014G0019 [Candidatus Peregrinibacteria bacterium GW2011_GWC2_39_14]|nr:MAG: hypothetical protein US92_C0008G0019 [Candidatus Peregrinibacteria bacterium GW2011_GWA2_38_36]KKR05021.1 MAG: hypothetical protein UT33_C0014G0019 [Candidatus Peregrinibacteria bacterium GW2011_GWC2_39_14]
MATERPDLDIFLSTYPEVVNVFGVSADTIRKWTEESRFDSLFGRVLPRAKREFDVWHRQNLLAQKADVEAEYARILQEHQARFAERVKDVCTFVGPKNHAQKNQDLAKLKGEFGLFPEDQIHELESDLVGKNVESWEDVPTGDQGRDLNEYFMRAIEQYGQDSISTFDENIHLDVNFTGFVRHVCVYDKKKPGEWKPIIEGDAAYIRNGKICLVRKSKGLGDRMDEVVFTWIEPVNANFKLQEYYGKSYMQGERSKLCKWVRNAKFPIAEGDKNGEIEVSYDGSAFYIMVKRDLSDYLSYKSFALRKGSREFEAFREELLSDPNFPSSIENIERLLPGKLS